MLLESIRSALRVTLTATALGVAAAPLSAQAATEWGARNYVEYVPGSAPIIIASPHGGSLRPTTVADRTYGVTAQDRRTQETARALAAAILDRTGRRPHLVISHLHRTKLDPNREVIEAAQGDPIAIQAWNDFHGFITTARAAVTADWGGGLFIDVHGHGHPEGWVELGYLLDASTLALSDPQIDQPAYRNGSSIRALASRPGASFPLLLRGTASLGGALQGSGIATVPSPVHPDPAGGNYFRGGYDTRRHGSQAGGTVDGVQIELPFSIREFSQTRAPFVDRTVSWLTSAFPQHWGLALDADPIVTIDAGDPVTLEAAGRATFVLERTGAISLSRTVVVGWDGSATPGVDYAPLPPTVTFGPGVRSVELEVHPLDDGATQGDRSIVGRVLGGALAGGEAAEVLILDDEGRPELTGAWTFDAGVGTTAHDSSGQAPNGTLEGGVSRLPGRSGGALRFDGVDDRVTIPDFDYAGPTGGTAVAFWFRTAATSGSYRYLFSHDSVGTANSLNVYFVQSTGVLRTALSFGNDLTDNDVLDVSRPLRDGIWHHYALSADPSGLTHVWIDGVVAATAHFGGSSFDPSGPLVVGGRSDLDPARFFLGELDELRVFSRPLSRVEVDGLVRGFGRDAAAFPGSAEGLELTTGVSGPPTAGPRLDVKSAQPGNVVDARYRAAGAQPIGSIGGLALAVFPTATPPLPLPGLAELHVAHNLILVDGPRSLDAAGGAFSITLPPNAGGLTMRLQALGLSTNAANGLFFASDAHEIRVR